MSKIKAYYATRASWKSLINGQAFGSYVSSASDFWVSTYGNDDYVLILLNGETDDHTAIANQAGINTADFDDIREGIDDPKDSTIITKAINNIDGLESSDFDNASTIRDVLTIIIQHLDPVQGTLSFDNTPKPAGTFADDFTGTNGDLLDSRTGWTLGAEGAYTAQIRSDAVTVWEDGSGSGLSYYICTDQGSANHYVQFALVNAATAMADNYSAARLVDVDNFIGMHQTGTGAVGFRLCKMVSGTLTDSIVSTQGVVDGIYKIECDGNTIRLFEDTGSGFSQVGTDQTITDHNTETSAGLVVGSATNYTARIDDFECGTVSSDSPINCTTGAVTVQGISATISTGTTISATTGVVLVSGENASVSFGKNIECTTGSISVTGISSSVELSKSINATTGSVLISGINSTISTSSDINCSTGSVVVNGILASVSNGLSFQATTGSVSISGIPAEVTSENAINCTTGLVSVFGINAEISKTKNIQTTTGGISVSGITASIENSKEITVGTGAISVSGIQADITSSVLIECTTGAVIISGVVAAIQTGEIPETPSNRTYFIEHEDRIFSIESEDRVFVIT